MLDNLTRVDQKGNDPNSANWRTRTFTYNSLSQLTQATNPESGTITYTYDSDGNLLTKVVPAPNQTNPAVTVTTTYTYDALHRLLTKNYSDTPASPDASLFYDQTNYNGLTITNGKGRRTGMSNVSGATAWSFDAEGAVKDERRTIGAITKTISYDYNLDGSLKFIVYPSGRRIDYTYDAAARAVSAVDLANAASYATVARYSPAGGLCSAKNGASITSTFTFNNRFQPNRVHVTTTGAPLNPCDPPAQTANILDFSYSFNQGTSNNGNVVSIANNRTPDRSQTFTYDELNRIKTAQSQATAGADCWGLSFGYDLWANLLAATVTKCSAPMLSVGVSTKNQINNTGFVYDAAGNLWQEPGRTYTYNAENQMTAAVGVTYVYDGDGKRVQKSNGKLYWYGMGSDPLAESDLAGTITDEFVFFGGKRVARRKVATGEVNYYFSDHLGSSRAVSSATGAILDDSDFYPFGGERIVTASTDNNYLFTGKERDSESGLDYFIARYYSSGYGRFLSPDEFTGGPVDAFSPSDPLPPGALPYADITNPQSLNKYNYALNNPLRWIDPTGHEAEDSEGPLSDATIDWSSCPPQGLYCNDKRNKKKKASSTVSQTPDAVAKALINEFIALNNLGNQAAAFLAGEEPPAEIPQLTGASAEEQGIIQGVSMFLIAMPGPVGKGKSIRLTNKAKELHHWLVVKHNKWFEARGLDIADFTESIGQLLHRGAGRSMHGKQFNLVKVWDNFRRRFPNATREQVLGKLSSIKKRWREFIGDPQ